MQLPRAEGGKVSAVTHIAAQPVQVGAWLRQRCAWCGAVLEDYDLTLTAGEVPVPALPGPPTWLAGTLVCVDGNRCTSLDHADGEQVPLDCCAALDPEATR